MLDDLINDIRKDRVNEYLTGNLVALIDNILVNMSISPQLERNAEVW